jgi:hypothetical protein
VSDRRRTSSAPFKPLLREWTEVVPAAERASGVTFYFDRPNGEPPQSILLVTPGTLNESWQWDDLVGAVNETLDLAKKRAVEPVRGCIILRCPMWSSSYTEFYGGAGGEL